MKKILLILSMLLFIPVLDAKVTNVNYTIDDYIVSSEIDISGNLLVKEIIKVDGSFNGYIRDIIYKNDNLDEFDGSVNSFYGSDIYNPSNIELYKVGLIETEEELSFESFELEIEEFSECNDSKLCYEKTEEDNGISLKMYNETNNGTTYFYIEYLLGNAVVLHNDVAELYYNFIGEGFDDDIKNYRLRVFLPDYTKEEIKVWAHGPLNGEVYIINDDDTNYGAYLTITNLNRNTSVDLRMTFPLNLIMVDHPFLKKSGVDALDNILKVETERADDANNLRDNYKKIYYGTNIIYALYILITLALIIYIYIKYDKEPKSEFNNEYNREFIDDYDVTVIEYLFDKNITDKAFSTSILNLIYKKKIKYEELDKKNYKLILNTNDIELTKAENELIDILFNEIGTKDSVTLKEIQEYSKKIVGDHSPFLKRFNKWKGIVESESIKEGFYENNSKTKWVFAPYSLLGIIIIFLSVYFSIFNILTFIVLLLTIIFIIYLIVFTKRTSKGALHYNKWKAFKHFLEDFGRFNEKELPEITLWERYLVYASIFGLADKVSKLMRVKITELNYNDNYMTNYLVWSNINHSINHSVTNSISTARSTYSSHIANSASSSGSGYGGGFSSGGGFGGGGGGGRGF